MLPAPGTGRLPTSVRRHSVSMITVRTIVAMSLLLSPISRPNCVTVARMPSGRTMPLVHAHAVRMRRTSPFPIRSAIRSSTVAVRIRKSIPCAPASQMAHTAIKILSASREVAAIMSAWPRSPCAATASVRQVNRPAAVPSLNTVLTARLRTISNHVTPGR